MDWPSMTVVVGSGRSGTSWVKRLLSEGMDIGFPREPKFVVPLSRDLRRFGDLKDPRRLRRLVETIHAGSLFQDLRDVDHLPTTPDEILDRVEEPTYTGVLYAVFGLVAHKLGNTRLGYKDPIDILHLPLIARLLPTAQFVHVVRDARDVALSYVEVPFGPRTLYGASRYWALAVSKARRDGAELAARYFEFRFEDLLLDDGLTARRLGQFLDGGRDTERVRDLMRQVETTKRPEAAYRWKRKMSARAVYACETAAGDVLEALGYPLVHGGAARYSPARNVVYFALEVAAEALRRLLARVVRRSRSPKQRRASRTA